VKTLDFRLVLGRSNWLPTPLCSHGLSPRLCHAFVNDVCGHKRKPFGPNCDVLSEAPFRRTVDDFVRAGVLSALLTHEPVALQAKLIHFSEHPT
jgi:hypothetical protein